MPVKPPAFTLPTPEERTETKGIVIKIPVPLHRRLMSACQEGDVTMQDTVAKMIEHCLGQLDGSEGE